MNVFLVHNIKTSTVYVYEKSPVHFKGSLKHELGCHKFPFEVQKQIETKFHGTKEKPVSFIFLTRHETKAFESMHVKHSTGVKK